MDGWYDKLFTYVRYNADLSPEGLLTLGCGHVASERVQKLDAVDAISELREIGCAAAAAVKPEHFAHFPA